MESFSLQGAQQLLAEGSGSWSVQRFLSRLDPGTLTSLCLEGISGGQKQLAAVGRFDGLTALELSSNSTPLPRNTAAVVGELTGLRLLVRAAGADAGCTGC